jgi:hypothetical protein
MWVLKLETAHAAHSTPAHAPGGPPPSNTTRRAGSGTRPCTSSSSYSTGADRHACCTRQQRRESVAAQSSAWHRPEKFQGACFSVIETIDANRMHTYARGSVGIRVLLVLGIGWNKAAESRSSSTKGPRGFVWPILKLARPEATAPFTWQPPSAVSANPLVPAWLLDGSRPRPHPPSLAEPSGPFEPTLPDSMRLELKWLDSQSHILAWSYSCLRPTNGPLTRVTNG